MKFRLVASEGMTLATAQSVAVSWRDPIFQRPTRTRILPSGKVVRREILMETPEDAPAPPISTDVLPGNLSPDTLRKLADLEEQKSRGEVTQTEYTVMRSDHPAGGSILQRVSSAPRSLRDLPAARDPRRRGCWRC